MNTRALRAHMVVTAVALLWLSAPGTTAGADGGREEIVRYVASPSDATVDLQELDVALGGVRFDIHEGEARLDVAVSDDVFDKAEVDVVFFFGDAPIRQAVTFCRQHAMDIPDGATHAGIEVERLFPLEEGEPSTCGADHGATTGTLTARFA